MKAGEGLHPNSRERPRRINYLMKQNTKNRKLVIMAVISALGMSFLTVGCQHEISRTQTTSVSRDGTVKTKEQTVTEAPDGTVTRTETRKTSTP